MLVATLLLAALVLTLVALWSLRPRRLKERPLRVVNLKLDEVPALEDGVLYIAPPDMNGESRSVMLADWSPRECADTSCSAPMPHRHVVRVKSIEDTPQAGPTLLQRLQAMEARQDVHVAAAVEQLLQSYPPGQAGHTSAVGANAGGGSATSSTAQEAAEPDHGVFDHATTIDYGDDD